MTNRFAVVFAMAAAMPTNNLFYCFSLILLSQIVFGVELTFDLPDSSRECFHQEIVKNTTAVLEYQVNWQSSHRIFFGLVRVKIVDRIL